MQKETRENFLAVACENGFRMKLHAIHGEFAMTQCHDFAIVAFRDDLEAPWKRTPFDDQRVVSASFKPCGQISEESASVMSDRG